MKAFLRLFFLFLPSLAMAEDPYWKGPWKGIPELIGVLEEIPEGRVLVKKAEAKDPQFRARLNPGEASFTESTFIRTYSLLDGKEEIILKHEVTLNKHLPLSEAVVDLAHELVHFTEKGMLDPYKKGFALKEFVKQGIEGAGGELFALEKECQVAWALESKFQNYPKHQLCAPYRQANNTFHLERARRDYYSVGLWHSRANSKLLGSLPINDSKTVFTSSYAGKPYPIALTEEFEATKKAACENNRKKFRLIAAQAGTRSPASSLLHRERMELQKYDKEFCGAAP